MDDILQKLNIWGSWCRVVQFSETDLPVGRVGHTAHVLPLDCDPIGERLLIIIIGGADPSKVLNEAFALDMVSLKWYTVGVAEGIDFPSLGRYEHSSAILCDQRLLIFGGATKSGPLCQLLRLQIDVHSTMTPTMAATTLNSSVPPEIQSINASIKQDDNQTAIEQFIWKPRTQHSSVSLTEHDQLLIFSGGDIGSQTVLDEKVYMYDNVVNSWTIIPVEGISPCSRLGHLILYESPYELINSTSERIPKGNLYIHGGMAGGELFDDLYALHFEQTNNDLNFKGVWNKLFPTIHQNTMDKQDYSSSRDLISAKLVSPGPRAAHGGTILTNKIFGIDKSKILIFGGFSSSGALNDMFCFDTNLRQWSEIRYETSILPGPRLDFAYCMFTLIVEKNNSKINLARVKTKSQKDERVADDNEVDDNDKYCQDYFFIHGGMDSQGTVFNDAYLILLTEYQLSNPMNFQTIIDRNDSITKCKNV